MNFSNHDETNFNMSKTFSEDDLVNDLDPMLDGGTFRVVFFRQCPFEVRQKDQQGKQYGERKMLNVRIMVSPLADPYQEIKIEITSEADIYFVYECKLNEKTFDRIKKMQSLNFNFGSSLNKIIKLLGQCDTSPQSYNCLLYMNKEVQCQLTIIQNIQYKSIELLALSFEGIDPELKKQCVSFRFSLLKAKNDRIQSKTKELLSIVKLKNPNLLQSLIKKTSSNTMGATMMMSQLNKSSGR